VTAHALVLGGAAVLARSARDVLGDEAVALDNVALMLAAFEVVAVVLLVCAARRYAATFAVRVDERAAPGDILPSWLSRLVRRRQERAAT
jgi:hypothetical protein